MNLFKIGIAVAGVMKLYEYWTSRKSSLRAPRRRDDQQHVMSMEEKLDQSLEESFPASDPPAHFIKTPDDINLH